MGKQAPEWQVRADGSVWILHSQLKPSDLDRLHGVEHLTVWNVRFPPNFLQSLPALRWLDVRGGSAPDLSIVAGCSWLQGIEVNQVRGLSDLSALETCDGLEFLMLYGLPQVQALPDLSRHTRLARVNLGQMRGLEDWSGLRTAPALDELYVSGRFTIDDTYVSEIARHPTLAAFRWEALDAPMKRRAEVIAAIGRPAGRLVRIEHVRAEAKQS